MPSTEDYPVSRDDHPWTESEAAILARAFTSGVGLHELAKRHLRSEEIVSAKLIEQGWLSAENPDSFNDDDYDQRVGIKPMSDVGRADQESGYSPDDDDDGGEAIEESACSPEDDDSEMDLIRDELADDANAYARSDEEGWFYEQ